MTNQLQKQSQSVNTFNSKVALIVGVAIGVLICAIGYSLFSSSNIEHNAANTAVPSTDKPLYWVAPMDPNFRRDAPGKSPMGMDLVPVYDDGSAEISPGTVSIDPVTIQNMGVKTATVEAKTPQMTMRLVGQVQYAQDAIEHVHSRIEGWVEVLNVRSQGDFIQKGEPLYSIYSPELVNAQEEFVISLRQNNPALINAAKLRLQSLAVPQSQIERLESTRQVSHTVTFLAPISGFIKSLNIQQGFYVEPSITMLSIASLNKVWVIADVFPKDASMLAIGQTASITSDEQPGVAFDAELTHIYPTLSGDTRTIQARFVTNNPQSTPRSVQQSLKPGMFTRVNLSVDRKGPDGKNSRVVVVPKQAVIRTGKRDRVVLVLGEGKFKSVQVTLGRDFDDVYEIIEGVVEGDEIVTSAQFLIDSESSISSDFARMVPVDLVEDSPHMHHDMTSDPQPSPTHDVEVSAWTEATINEVNVEKRTVNLTHGYLDAFNMMGMTMNFTVSSDIDIHDFVEGASAHVEIIREDSGMFQVKTLHVMESSGDTSDSNEHLHDHSQGMGDHE